MEVKFDMVRIGKLRSEATSEILLRQNTEFLMKDIRHFLQDKECTNGVNSESVTLVVPGKGLKPKFRLQDFRDKYIRSLMKKKYQSYIYSGNLDTIMDNVSNKVFRRMTF